MQQYAAVQLIDGTTQQGLQTVGQYKGEELKRAGTITSLGATIGSSSAANNSEVATLGTISTARSLLCRRRTTPTPLMPLSWSNGCRNKTSAARRSPTPLTPTSSSGKMSPPPSPRTTPIPPWRCRIWSFPSHARQLLHLHRQRDHIAFHGQFRPVPGHWPHRFQAHCGAGTRPVWSRNCPDQSLRYRALHPIDVLDSGLSRDAHLLLDAGADARPQLPPCDHRRSQIPQRPARRRSQPDAPGQAQQRLSADGNTRAQRSM